jgi:hypothetical protein
LWEAVFENGERASVPRCIAVAALTLTGPFGVLLVPAVSIGIAVRRIRSRASRIHWVVIATYFLAVAVQTFVMLKHPQTPKGGHDFPWLDWMVRAMFGDFLPAPLSIGIAGYVFAVAVIGLCMLSRARLAFVALFGFSVLLWGLGITRTAPVLPIVWFGYGARYLYPWGIFLLWSLTLVTVVAKGPGIRNVSAVLILLVLLASGEKFEAVVQKPWAIDSTPTSYQLTVPPGWSIVVPR